MPPSKEPDLVGPNLKNQASTIDRTEDQRIKVGAGAAGAGSGTLLALIANNMPDENFLKPWLIIVAPSMSIVSGVVWIWLQVKIANFIREREFKIIMGDAKELIELALQDSDLSEERHNELLRVREELNKLEIDRVMNKVKALRVITSNDLNRSTRV